MKIAKSIICTKCEKLIQPHQGVVITGNMHLIGDNGEYCSHGIIENALSSAFQSDKYAKRGEQHIRVRDISTTAYCHDCIISVTCDAVKSSIIKVDADDS